MVATVPVALALLWGNSVAQAAPQDFVTPPGDAQGTVTAPDSAQSQTTDTAPVAPEREYLGSYVPSPQVQQSPGRSYADYAAGRQQSQTTTAPAVYRNSAPAPAVEAAPAVVPAPVVPAPPTVQRPIIEPIDVEPGKILLGDRLADNPAPNLIDARLERQLNDTQAAIQADGANAIVATGLVDAPQADRAAAGAIGGGLTGAALAGTACGVPAGVLGAVGGAALGFAVGTALATPAVVVAPPPLNFVFIPGAAALGGSAGGAALAGGGAALACGTAGAAAGALIGATAFGGQRTVIEEPAPLAPPPAPPAPPVIDGNAVQGAVTQWAEQTGADRAVESARTAVTDTATRVQNQAPLAVAAVRAAVTAAQAVPVVDRARAALDSAVASLPRLGA